MSRLVLAALLAVTLHGLFFWVKWDWTVKKPVPRKPDPIALDLTILQPVRKTPRPVIQAPKTEEITPPLSRVPIFQKTPPKNKPAPPPKFIKKRTKKIRQLKPSQRPSPSAPLRNPPAKDPLSKDVSVMAQSVPTPPVQTATVHPEPERQSTFTAAPDGAERQVPSNTPLKEAVPMYKRNPPPLYPRVARRRGLEGTVMLDVFVTAFGNVGDLRINQSSGYPVLDRSAVAAVKGWLFEPGMRGDDPVDMWVTVPIRFRLAK